FDFFPLISTSIRCLQSTRPIVAPASLLPSSPVPAPEPSTAPRFGSRPSSPVFTGVPKSSIFVLYSLDPSSSCSSRRSSRTRVQTFPSFWFRVPHRARAVSHLRSRSPSHSRRYSPALSFLLAQSSPAPFVESPTYSCDSDCVPRDPAPQFEPFQAPRSSLHSAPSSHSRLWVSAMISHGSTNISVSACAHLFLHPFLCICSTSCLRFDVPSMRARFA
ncbi:hypothetical protein B0H14DRAFT_3610947, partial [Mycena olivaceomarginata]